MKKSDKWFRARPVLRNRNLVMEPPCRQRRCFLTPIKLFYTPKTTFVRLNSFLQHMHFTPHFRQAQTSMKENPVPDNAHWWLF